MTNIIERFVFKTDPLLRHFRHVGHREEDGRESFEVHPDGIFPPTLKEMAAALHGEADFPTLRLEGQVRALVAGATDIAALPRDRLDTEQRKIRAATLDLARLWFTARLHERIQKRPMHLRILNGPAWRYREDFLA